MVPDPTHRHYRWAVVICAKFGIGTAHEIGGVDGGPIVFAAVTEEARDTVKRRLKALADAQRRRHSKDARDPAKALPPEKPPQHRRPRDPEQVIATFYDGGLPKAKQEPTETAEAVAEDDAPRPSWPPPGRAVVSDESLRSRLF